MKSAIFVFCTLFAAGTCSAGVPKGYDVYIEWDRLANLKYGVRTHLASSYDRNGGNYDYSWYESPAGRVTWATDAIVKTIDGPGILYRFWMPHLMTGLEFPVKLYFDGETVPRFSTDSKTLLDELAYAYFDDFNLVNTCAGGQTLLEPIPFETSLRIETYNYELINWSYGNYYQYTYVTLPQSEALPSWTPTLSSEQQAARQAVIDLFENAGSSPLGNDPQVPAIQEEDMTLPAGGTLNYELSGPGAITKLTFKLTDPNDAVLDHLRLVLTYDQAVEPGIDACFADFFGAGHLRPAYRSLPLGTDAALPDQGYYCYLPIPFHQRARIGIQNHSQTPAQFDRIRIEYEQRPLDGDTCYLYVKVNHSLRQSGQIYHPMLSVTGRGHYIGDLLYIEHDKNSFYLLEGDDVIAVDGDYILYGTGLEDTYNGGAYYNWCCPPMDGEPEGKYPVSAARPLNGILYVDKRDAYARADQYRWRLADCIPFEESLEVKIENRYAELGARFRSVAFWYQLPYPSGDYRRFETMAGLWNAGPCGSCEGMDLTGDGEITAADIEIFAQRWLGPIIP